MFYIQSAASSSLPYDANEAAIVIAIDLEWKCICMHNNHYGTQICGCVCLISLGIEANVVEICLKTNDHIFFA